MLGLVLLYSDSPFSTRDVAVPMPFETVDCLLHLYISTLFTILLPYCAVLIGTAYVLMQDYEGHNV